MGHACPLSEFLECGSRGSYFSSNFYLAGKGAGIKQPRLLGLGGWKLLLALSPNLKPQSWFFRASFLIGEVLWSWNMCWLMSLQSPALTLTMMMMKIGQETSKLSICAYCPVKGIIKVCFSITNLCVCFIFWVFTLLLLVVVLQQQHKSHMEGVFLNGSGLRWDSQPLGVWKAFFCAGRAALILFIAKGHSSEQYRGHIYMCLYKCFWTPYPF